MLSKLQNEWRSAGIFVLWSLMLLGVFTSRAMLSVSIIVFVILSFCHKNWKIQLHTFLTTPVLAGMSLLFMLPFLSGIWSEDKAQWIDLLRIKLPLVALPLAFAAPFGFVKKHWEFLAFIFLMVVLAATAWSMFHYTADMAAINRSYLRAKTIVTPLGNDHVRFSWLVAVAALISGWMVWEKWKLNKSLAWILAVITAWLIVFLHILAARTGLFSFYFIAGILGAWLIFLKSKPIKGILLLMTLAVLPLLAYLFLPSFRNRVNYIKYDFGFLKEAKYQPGSNDAVRVISMKTGWGIMLENPLLGTGFGDIAGKAKEYYDRHYPGMLEQDKILPSSEWLIYGSGCGWPGFLLFTAITLIPFFMKVNKRLPWILLNCTAAFSFMFDIALEVQFGVFLYSFVILSCWKGLVIKKM